MWPFRPRVVSVEGWLGWQSLLINRTDCWSTSRRTTSTPSFPPSKRTEGKRCFLKQRSRIWAGGRCSPTRLAITLGCSSDTSRRSSDIAAATPCPLATVTCRLTDAIRRARWSQHRCLPRIREQGFWRDTEEEPCWLLRSSVLGGRIRNKKTTTCIEDALAPRVCLSRWSSCRSSDARRFRSFPRSCPRRIWSLSPLRKPRTGSHL
jgi:hypothetical protein